uniref:Uncharacterized protein n=1 Tax=Aureoumbra lagunensis TaxID=44058 RepID=A0A7S3NG64_9STRA
MKKTKKRGWQKFEQGSWQSVPRNRLLQLTKLEAQAWLALFALVMHPQVRKRYGFNSFRKATLLRARKYLNELILDQLPALADLQRFMDELAIVDTPEPTAFADRAGGSGLLLEQVAALRDRAIGKQDLDKVAQHQIKFIWNKDNLHLDKTDLSHLVDIYSGPDDAAFGQEKEGQSVQELLERLRIEKNNKSVPKGESLTEEKKQIALQEVSSRPLPGKTETDPTPAAVNTKSSKPLVQVLDDDKKNEHLPTPPPRSNKPLIVEVDHSTTDEPIVEDITTSVSAVEEVVQEKKIDSIVPPEQPPSHDNEVTSVELQLRDKTILLIRQAESKIVPSPDGRHFQRVKWVPASPLLISFRDSLTLRVRLSMETTPKLISLDFYNELAEHFDPPPLRKIWHQIGDVEDDLAAQLFLILQPREPSSTSPIYKVSSLYVSTPISIIPGINSPE